MRTAPKTLEAAIVRREMVSRGFVVRDFAQVIGCHPRRFSNALAAGFPAGTEYICHRIEQALGRLIWTSPAEAQTKQRIAGLLGLDIYSLSRRELFTACKSRGIPAFPLDSQVNLRVKLEQFAEAQRTCKARPPAARTDSSSDSSCSTSFESSKGVPQGVEDATEQADEAP